MVTKRLEVVEILRLSISCQEMREVAGDHGHSTYSVSGSTVKESIAHTLEG